MNKIKKFLCWLGWHSFGYNYISTDGVNTKAQCKWCKGVGLVDSQGNLFAIENGDSDE